MSQTIEDLDYIAVAPCGCWRIWMAADSDVKQRREFYRTSGDSGLEIKRVTTEAARTLPHGCDKCRKS